MGSDKQEGSRRSRDSRPPSLKPGSQKKGMLYAFNPTEEEKRAIKDDSRSSDLVIERLSDKVSEGHKLNVRYNEKHDAYMAMLQEGTVQWDNAITISCWHKNMDMALRMLDYALAYRYPDFPSGILQMTYADLEW